VNSEQLSEIIQTRFPQVRVLTCRPILDGWDSFVLEVNGELIFRFPRRPEVEAQLDKEIALLPALAEALPIAVPRFEFIYRGGNGRYDRPFVGYRKIAGVPLSADCLRPAQADELAGSLARFLSALHRFPVELARRLKVSGSDAGHWRQEYFGLYTWAQGQVFPLLAPTTRRKAAALWEGFLADDANFEFRPCLIHRDLAGEHILCDPARGLITGVIDWGDAAIGDPALDFVGLLWAAGRDFTEAVLAGYQGQVDETFWDRMAFYARLAPIYEIHFGLATGDKAHLDAGLESLTDPQGGAGSKWLL
jgi:aminoglycoside 2''-phosphotransferase